MQEAKQMRTKNWYDGRFPGTRAGFAVLPPAFDFVSNPCARRRSARGGEVRDARVNCYPVHFGDPKTPSHSYTSPIPLEEIPVFLYHHSLYFFPFIGTRLTKDYFTEGLQQK
jgi:hypothetical protein